MPLSSFEYETKNDDSTTCHFCANECSRTFIDAFRPDGSTSRYISGFSCEKGMVESKDAMEELVQRAAQDHPKEFPNLVTLRGAEGLQAPGRSYDPCPRPEPQSST